MWIALAWQTWPAYLLILTALLFPARFRRTRMALLALLATIALGAWVILPAPSLPPPSGPFVVGTETWRWIDASRSEDATADASDRRNVILQSFYPVAKDTKGAHSIYLDGLHNLPDFVSVMPRFLLRNFGHVDTHAVAEAPISTANRWPVIVFSPGYGAPRSFYTGLITELASRGIVVLAIDHPYEAGVAQLSDGRVVSTTIVRLPNDPDLLGYMALQQDTRVADIRFALDRISQLPLAKQLDLSQITAAGHSFGGAASLAAMDRDVRIRAAVNIDGTPYGALPDRHLDRPVMILQSDPEFGKHGEAYKNGNGRILSNLSGVSGYRYTFRRTNHFSFSDFPLFFSIPGRWLISTIAGPANRYFDAGLGCLQCIAPVQSVHATADMLTAFLYDTTNLEQVAVRYPFLTGGRVSP